MNTLLAPAIAFAAFSVSFLVAQRLDETQLKQVIIFGRHGVRSPVLPNSTLNNFSVRPFPTFSVSDVNLTTNGSTNETSSEPTSRLWLTKEGLLTGKDSADASFVYFRANRTPLIMDTARAFAAGFSGRPVLTSIPIRHRTEIRCSIQ